MVYPFLESTFSLPSLWVPHTLTSSTFEDFHSGLPVDVCLLVGLSNPSYCLWIYSPAYWLSSEMMSDFKEYLWFFWTLLGLKSGLPKEETMVKTLTTLPVFVDLFPLRVSVVTTVSDRHCRYEVSWGKPRSPGDLWFSYSLSNHNGIPKSLDPSKSILALRSVDGSTPFAPYLTTHGYKNEIT